MVRELINKLTRSITGRTVSQRRRRNAPIKIWFDPDKTVSGKTKLSELDASITGETVDMSRTGIAFIVSSIRIKEKYLVGHERPLNVELQLPNGPVRLRAIGRRYEKVGADAASEKFLVGATILDLTGDDKDLYEDFVRKGGANVKPLTASLELGID